MSKGLKTAVFIVLAATIIALLIRLGLPRGSAAANGLRPAALSPFVPLDLAEFYDQDPSFNAPGCWQAVPRGLQTLATVPFRISGLIQLWGEGPAGIGRNYRERVEGIPASAKFQAIYVLHGSSFATAAGTPIAALVIHYVDGSAGTNWIRYGTDSRDWWEPLTEANPLPTNGTSQIVWRGDHPTLPDWARGLRLFATAIPNPKPESEVKSIDLVSTRSRVTWIVLSLTTGPAGALKPDAQLQKDNAPPEQLTLNLTALDASTAQPVQEMRFRVSLVNGRRLKPYGVFAADERGQALIDLPPQHIRLVSVEAFSPNYASEVVSWNLDKGEVLPTNYLFKVSREAP